MTVSLTLVLMKHWSTIVLKILEEFSVSVYVVRELCNGVNRETDRPYGIALNRLFLCDVLDSQPILKKRLGWIHRCHAITAMWLRTNADEENNQVLRTVSKLFEEANGEVPLRHPEPCRNVGWYEGVSSWICCILERRGMKMVGTIQRHLLGSTSVVARCKAKPKTAGLLDSEKNTEIFYIKNSLRCLREAQRTLAAAEVVKDIVPEVIGADFRLGLLMQRDVGSVTDKPYDQHALVSTVLKMQTLSLKHLQKLEYAGLKVRDFTWLDMNLESIMNHKLLDKFYELADGKEEEDDKEYLLYLRSRTNVFRRKCGELLKLGLPQTLVHGDLDLRNVGSPVESTEKTYRIFDWAKSFIGNPLHDFDTLLRSPQLDYTEVKVDIEAALRQVCRHWKLTATIEEMNEALITVGSISVLVEIYDLIEQHQRCDANRVNERGVLLGAIKDQLAGLCL